MFSTPGSADDWDSKWTSLNQYDGFAGTLKTPDGAWIAPKEEIISTLKILAPEIEKASQTYGVDARAIAGAILAENTLNHTISDSLQDFLVKYKLAKNGAILGKKFSFGLGQINVSAAREAEPLIAKAEGRAPRSDEELAQELLKPVSAIQYIGALMRKYQDIYAEKGFDISKSPGILATVYNLGKAEARAAEAQASSRAPRVNYFGFFVDKNIGELQKLVKNTPAAAKTEPSVNATQGAPAVQPAPGQATAQTPVIRKFLAARQEMPLLSSPPRCSREGQGTEADYARIKTLANFPRAGALKAGETFEVLAPGLGCDLDGWSLVQGKGGSGWISDQELEKLSKKVVAKVPKTCNKKPAQDCAQKIQAKYPNQVLRSLPAEIQDGLELRIAGASTGDSQDLTWKKPLIGKQQTAAVSKMGLNSSIGVEEAKKILQKLEEKRTRILGEINQSLKAEGKPSLLRWNDSGNPYRELLSSKFPWQAIDEIAQQKPDAVYHFNRSATEIETYLARPFAVPVKSLAELKELYRWEEGLTVVSEATGLKDSSGQKIDEKQYRQNFKTVVSDCRAAVEGLPKSQPLLESLMTKLESASISEYPLKNPTFTSVLEELKKDCLALISLTQPKSQASTDPDGRSDSGNGNGLPMADCRITVTTDDPALGFHVRSMTLSNELLRGILKSQEDRDAFIADHFRDVLNYFHEDRDSGKPGYDPFATAEMITQILAQPCVQAVFVPDPWLLKKLGSDPRYQKRVIYRPFLEEDRFLVDTSAEICKE
jgi:hypothetical protein